MGTVNIQLFGTPCIEVENCRLNLSLKKAEAMVYYLAIEGKTSREKLATLLWGAKDESSAYNNFRNALYLLHRNLPEGFIRSDRRTVSLSKMECDMIDIDKIADLNTPVSPCIFKDFLEEFDIKDSSEFDKWLMVTRTQIKKKIADKLKERITQCYDAEDEDKLENALESMLKIDPFDEDSILELMELYAKHGEVAHSATVYREYRVRLREELGLLPSDRAEVFFRKLKASFPENQEVHTLSPDTFFLGRALEQELIHDKIKGEPSQPIVIFIDGEPGIGKTSLLQKILATIKDSRNCLFSTISYEVGVDYPYSSWNNLVSQAADFCNKKQLESGDINFSLLAGVFPNLSNGQRIVYNADFVKISQITPIVIGQAVSHLVVQAAAGRRPVIILEDLHWFDKQSIHLLETFLSTLCVPSIIFVTSRPEKSEYALRVFARIEANGKIRFLHIPLKPFDQTETNTFFRHFLDKNLIDSFEHDYLYKESEGVPLFITELIKMLSSNSGTVLRESGLGGIMLARFGEMQEMAKEFLRVLSVFTNGASVSAITIILDSPMSQIAEIAEELLRKRLIKEIKCAGNNVILDFYHTKVRECVYESIPDFKLSGYHKKVSELLNRNYSPEKWDPALSSLLVYHYTKAGLPAKVFSQHLREMIFDITINHDLFPLVQDDILYSCTLPYSDRKDTERRMEEMKRLLRNIHISEEEEKDTTTLQMEASYLELYGGYLIGWGEYGEGRIFINKARKIARQYGFNNIHIHCLQHIGHHFLQTDNAQALMDTAREMLTVAQHNEREKYMGVALRFIGVAYQILGEYNKSEKVLLRSIETFREQAILGKCYTINALAAECYIGENYHWQANFTKAIEHFQYCVDVCKTKKLFWGYSHFCAHLADVAFDLGDLDMMYTSVYSGTEMFEKCQGGRCGSILYSLKAIADAKQGKNIEAYRSLENSERLSAPIKKKSWTAVHALAKAYLCEMLEQGLLSAEFNKILYKNSKEYALEAYELYKAIPVPHRLKKITEHFNLRI